MAGELPPIEINFVPLGIDKAKDAFQTIEQAAMRLSLVLMKSGTIAEAFAKATQDAFKKTAQVDGMVAKVAVAAANLRARALQSEADSAIQQFSRMTQAQERFAKSMARGVNGGSLKSLGGGGSRGGGGGDGGGIGSAALSNSLDLFRSGLDLAYGSLTQFGGFLKEAVTEDLKASKNAAQLSNRMQGVSTEQVLGAMRGFGTVFAAIDSDKIRETFENAIDSTHDFAKAQQVTQLALKAGSAYGFEPGKLASILADKKGMLDSFDPAQLEGYVSALFQKTATMGDVRPEEFARIGDSLATMVDRFPNENQNQKAATDLGLTGLIAQSAGGRKGGASGGMRGLEALLRDLDKNQDFFKSKTGTQFNDLRDTIPRMLAMTGGNLSKVGQGAGGVAMGDVIKSRLSTQSFEFLRSLGLENTYREAEGKEKGSGESAVRSQLEAIMTAGDSAKDLDEKFKKVDLEPIVEFERAMRELKVAFAAELTPVIKNSILPAFQNMKGPLKELVEALAKMMGDLAKVDMVGVFKAMMQGIAAVLFGVLKMVNMLPNVNIDAGAMSTLESFAAGTTGGRNVGEDEANKRLHPEEYDNFLSYAANNALADPEKYAAEALRNKYKQAASPMPQQPSLAPGDGVLAPGFKLGADNKVTGPGAPTGPSIVKLDAASANAIGTAVGNALNKAGPQTPMSDPARLATQN